MLVGIEEILLKENPDYLLVYGDTNSTLAGALAASKIHIEAGLRSFNVEMPEEQNRVLTDHISKFLFCSTNTAVENLKHEGITENVYMIGDVMCDAVLHYSKKINEKDEYFRDLSYIFGKRSEIDKWYLATVHRAENTNSIEKLRTILNAFEKFDAPVIIPASVKYLVSLANKNDTDTLRALMHETELYKALILELKKRKLG